jgi:hypothetical protein
MVVVFLHHYFNLYLRLHRFVDTFFLLLVKGKEIRKGKRAILREKKEECNDLCVSSFSFSVILFKEKSM